MDEPHDPLISRDPPAADEDLRGQLQAIRSAVLIGLVAITVVSCWLSLFLYRQVVNTNRQTVEARRIIDDFQTNAAPRINWFVSSLQVFAKTNADFNLILSKYIRQLQPSAPAPATTAPKK